MAISLTAPAHLEVAQGLRGRDFISIRDLTPAELLALLALSSDVKQYPALYERALAGRIIGLIFEKPSLRTRVSFDVAAHQLGGHAVYLSPAEVGLGKRESIPDVARTLEQMVQGIVARTFTHGTVEDLARAASVPVVNALSDFSHPCQALADYLTILEVKGTLKGLRLAYVGDGNNVAHSLILAGALLGVRVVIGAPKGHEPSPAVIDWAREHAVDANLACEVTSAPEDAVRNADVVYTDTWVSMGQEAEAEARRREFAGFKVDERLFSYAKPDAVFMHCLPAHRGEEVDASVIDSPRSVIFQQAENRLHTEKALLIALLRGATAL